MRLYILTPLVSPIIEHLAECSRVQDGFAQAGYPLLTDNGAPPGLIEMRNVLVASASRKVVGAEDLGAIRLSVIPITSAREVVD
jgi:hypothetical protein